MKKTVKVNSLSSRKYANILGIKVLSTSRDSLLANIEDFISHNRKFYIVTPNPELVLSSAQDPRLKSALNNSDLPVPDGIGLTQAAKYLSLPIPGNILLKVIVGFFQGLLVGAATFINKEWLASGLNLIKGRVLFPKLVELADKKNWRIFFLGGEGREAEITANELRVKHPSLQVQTSRGPMLNNNAVPVEEMDRRLEKEVFEKINKFEPKLLFVAFGNPKQEIWIHKNLSKLNVIGAMAVGGTFRYIAGMSKLPPEWVSKLGFEWLWRLVTEPYRIGRIWNAVVVFPLKVFLYKVTH